MKLVGLPVLNSGNRWSRDARGPRLHIASRMATLASAAQAAMLLAVASEVGMTSIGYRAPVASNRTWASSVSFHYLVSMAGARRRASSGSLVSRVFVKNF